MRKIWRDEQRDWPSFTRTLVTWAWVKMWRFFLWDAGLRYLRTTLCLLPPYSFLNPPEKTARKGKLCWRARKHWPVPWHLIKMAIVRLCDNSSSEPVSFHLELLYCHQPLFGTVVYLLCFCHSGLLFCSQALAQHWERPSSVLESPCLYWFGWDHHIRDTLGKRNNIQKSQARKQEN